MTNDSSQRSMNKLDPLIFMFLIFIVSEKKK